MITNYLPAAQWHYLIANLVAAAHHPADPQTAVAEIICGFVAPESARNDIEAEAARAA